MVQWLWLRFYTSTAGGGGSVPVWGTKSPQAVLHSLKKQTNKQTNKKKTGRAANLTLQGWEEYLAHLCRQVKTCAQV